jgi:hypothetical protein
MPFSLYFDPTGDILESARACESDVFLQTYGNTREQLADEYGPYESSAVFIAIADSEDRVVGTVRLIMPGEAGLKIFHDIQAEPWSVNAADVQRRAGIDPSRAWEIATLSVRRELKGRSMLTAAALYHGLIQTIRANDIGTVAMIVDKRFRALLHSVSLVQHALPGTGPQAYLGSPSSTPVYAKCPDVIDLQRRINPDAYRLVSQGIGLDGISVPDLSEFKIRRPVRELALVTAHSSVA